MLEFTIPTQKTEGTWEEFVTRGVKIRLKLRPLTPEISEKLEKGTTKVEMFRDPETRKVERVKIKDDEAHFTAMLDYVIEDMEGLRVRDGETGRDVPNTDIRAKKTLLLRKQPDGEPSLWTAVLDRAREMGECIVAAEEDDLKN